ncbi:MAG: tRNA glutamyl-Q(34) synthetase GluQRS [Betaproteobacteria bacterium]
MSAPPAPTARYRGRFAPSPSGPLHFGSLLAALASYCDARAVNGEWLVRIEDVDTPRSRPGAATAILQTLEQYGFQWDGPVVHQSARHALYDQALTQLDARSALFACICSRRDLALAPLSATGERRYPGTCRIRASPAVAGRQHAVRVAVGEGHVEFIDRLQGLQRQDLARDVGDFIVQRADGLHAYQLAVVIDDAAQGINAIVRGADLLASTPRQIFLQRLLGLPVPSYLHVPVAINCHGAKLSKQTFARRLPDAPVPALIAAWQFLDQPELPDAALSITEFWAFAHAAWSPRRLPPVPMLLSPAQFDKSVPADGRV